MAILSQLHSGRMVSLNGHSIIGRSPACTIMIAEPEVSGEHASIRFTGDAWTIRDLGSRNGTWIDGSRLSAGEEARLKRGSRLSFGNAQRLWRVEEITPPGPSARCLAPPRVVNAADGLLLLPDPDDPQLAVFTHGPGWAIEQDGVTRPANPGEVVTIGQERWQLLLPGVLEPTISALPTFRLRFRVSRDEEFAALDVVNGETVHPLTPRRHHYLLLTLARIRLQDHGLPPTTRGWIDQDDLANQLELSTQTVNVHVFRARQELGAVNAMLSSQLIERRSGTRQLRFGFDEVEINLV
ncbi:MAG: FHA domain-containing protein [Myxococcota bacterium]